MTEHGIAAFRCHLLCSCFAKASLTSIAAVLAHSYLRFSSEQARQSKICQHDETLAETQVYLLPSGSLVHRNVMHSDLSDASSSYSNHLLDFLEIMIFDIFSLIIRLTFILYNS